jgi:hypothetical protein
MAAGARPSLGSELQGHDVYEKVCLNAQYNLTMLQYTLINSCQISLHIVLADQGS